MGCRIGVGCGKGDFWLLAKIMWPEKDSCGHSTSSFKNVSGTMAQQLKALVYMQRSWIWFTVPACQLTSAYNSSSGLHGHYTHTHTHTHMQAHMHTHTHTNMHMHTPMKCVFFKISKQNHHKNGRDKTPTRCLLLPSETSRNGLHLSCWPKGLMETFKHLRCLARLLVALHKLMVGPIAEDNTCISQWAVMSHIGA